LFAQASVAALSLWNVWLLHVAQQQPPQQQPQQQPPPPHTATAAGSNDMDDQHHGSVSTRQSRHLSSGTSQRLRWTYNLSVTDSRATRDTPTLRNGKQLDRTAKDAVVTHPTAFSNLNASLSSDTRAFPSVSTTSTTATTTPLATTRSVPPPPPPPLTVSSRNNVLLDKVLAKNTPAFQVLEQYQQWHSASVLESESLEQLQQRRFALAFYSCPHQVGHRMHHFMNSLIWSIVTNRTVLVHYLDTAACWSLSQRQVQITWRDRKQCPSANTQAECNDTLALAAWLPSYHNVASRLAWPSRLSVTAAGKPVNDTRKDSHKGTRKDTHKDSHQDPVTPVLVDYWSTSSYLRAPDWERGRFPPLNGTQQSSSSSSSAEYYYDTAKTKVDALDHVLVDFPELVGKQSIFYQPVQRQHLLVTEAARDRAAALTHAGMEFLYGLLFAKSFALQGIPASLVLRNDNNVASAHQQLQMVPNNNAFNTTKESSFTDSQTTNTSTPTATAIPYSIALHSRHRQGEDGTNIRAQTKCLRQLLDGAAAAAATAATDRNDTVHNASSLQCRVCLMSDRPATVSALATWLQNEYPMCIVVDAARAVPPRNVRVTAASFRMEHGPNAGAAFLHELNVCQHYTDAFIGTAMGGSSSTALLEEWIAYQHYLKTKQTSRQLMPSDLPTPTAKCWL
jgi:hypothetical protein